MAILQLWVFDAGSFHIKNFVADFIRMKLNFIKNNKIAFWATLWGTYGYVHTISIARWKARGQLPIRHNWTFSLSLTVETLQAEICRSRRFSKGWVTLTHKLQTKGGVARQPLLVSENQGDCLFVWYQPIRSALFGFLVKHACDRQTDGQTNGQNCDS